MLNEKEGLQVNQDQAKRIELGEKAKSFLASSEWIDLIKPIIDSMLLGLKDATTIDVSSDKKAAIEVKSRTLAAKYITEIQTLIEGYIIDAQTVVSILEKKNNRSHLYKRID